jgi:hypothetical protein
MSAITFVEIEFCNECGTELTENTVIQVINKNGCEYSVCNDCSCMDDYYPCYECGVFHYHEQITFINEEAYCFTCAPKCCIECDSIMTEDDKLVSECMMCAECFLFIGTGKKFHNSQITRIINSIKQKKN